MPLGTSPDRVDPRSQFVVMLLPLATCVVSTEPWAGPSDGIWGFIMLFIFTNDKIKWKIK